MWAEKYIEIKTVANAKGKLYVPLEDALIGAEIAGYEMSILSSKLESRYNSGAYNAIVSRFEGYTDIQIEIIAERDKPRDR